MKNQTTAGNLWSKLTKQSLCCQQ